MAELVIGVDVGTSFTAAAASIAGRVEAVQLRHDGPVTPSVVFVREDRTVAVGEVAVRLGARDPQGVVREFKRRFGDSVPFVVRGSPFTAEQLTAEVLASVLHRCREVYGAAPARVALTHPAAWTPYQTGVLLAAADLAGVGPRVLMTEPQAAALAYAHSRPVEDGSSVAVFDLGGGTFDATILQRSGSGFDLRGEPVGIERLGGIDFDLVVFEHVRRSVDGAVDRLEAGDPAVARALNRLRAACVAAKEDLSSETATTIEVSLPGVEAEVRLTRDEFEAMIEPALQRTVEALRRALRGATLDDGDVAVILLVGGSTRIPLVSELLGRSFAAPVTKDLHPKLAVATGAALGADPATPRHLPARRERRRGSPAGPDHDEHAAADAAPVRSQRRVARLALAGAAVAAFALVVTAATLWSQQRDPSSPGGPGGGTTSGPSTTAVTTPSSTATTTPSTLFGGGLDRGDVWAATVAEPGLLVRLDGASGDPVVRIPVPLLEEEPVVTDEVVWTAGLESERQSVVLRGWDRSTGEVLHTVELPRQEQSPDPGVEVLAADDGVWVVVSPRVPPDAAPEVFRVDSAGELAAASVVEGGGGAVPDHEPVTDGSALFLLVRNGVARVEADGALRVEPVDGAERTGLALAEERLYVVGADGLHVLGTGPEPGPVERIAYRGDGGERRLLDAGTAIELENVFADGANLTFVAGPADGSAPAHFFRVDRTNGEVHVDVALPGAIGAGAYDLRQTDAGTFWAYQSDSDPPALLRIDATGAIHPVELEARGSLDPDVTTNGGAIVVSDVDPSGSPTVYLVDPATATLTRRLDAADLVPPP